MLVIPLTLAVLVGYASRTLDFREKGLLLFGMGLAVLLYWTVRPLWLQHSGYPLQTFVPAIGLGLLGWRLPNRPGVQLGVMLTFFVMTAVLMLHGQAISERVFAQVIYSERRLYHHRQDRDSSEALQQARERLTLLSSTETRAYPPGWLTDLRVGEHAHQALCTSDKDRYYRRHSKWHSRLTGLYFIDEYDIWYPGGSLNEAIPRIEIRKRTSAKRLNMP